MNTSNAKTKTNIVEKNSIEKGKDEFIALASHELKNPITTLKAFGQILQRHLQTNNDTQGAQYLSKMQRQINKLSTLVDDFLDISHIQSGQFLLKKEKFKLEKLIEEIIEDVQIINTDYDIEYKPTNNVEVEADKYRINQILINLLTNAIKYSPHKKNIKVTLEKISSQAVVSVQDSGLGIAKDKTKQIFERFYRVQGKKESTFPGLGLGLYISKEIIKKHEGRIWVESEPGKGSTFFFSLPLK